MPDNNTEQPTEFAELLLKHSKGRAHTKASELLREAVAAVVETGKAASVTVTFGIAPMRNNPEAVQISDKVTAKVPEERRDSIWYADTEGGLHRNSPSQMDLYDNA